MVGMRSRQHFFASIMRLFVRCLRLGRRRRLRLLKRIQELWRYGRLCYLSLVYNSFTNSDVIIDSLFEPIYWLVDHVTRWFGVVFVALVIVLTSSIVLIVYICVLPIILQTYSAAWISWHVTYGHWNLIMIVFHYYKAITTAPGYPPQAKTEIPAVSICRKCISPKPARTHHCSICNRCILKMDHHCPWLNNCVGHYNHRYFLSFCVFMTMGCMYCSISSREMFREAYAAIEKMKLLEKERLQFAANQTYYQSPPPVYTFREKMFHKCIVYLWVLCRLEEGTVNIYTLHFTLGYQGLGLIYLLGYHRWMHHKGKELFLSVAFALGALTLWHVILISRGETSIERHINKKEKNRLQQKGDVFRNPYSYGTVNNWKVFLGVERKKHWLTRVLLPSSHSPDGDGLIWNTPSCISYKPASILAI